MRRLLLVTTILVLALPADLVAGHPNDAGEAVRGHQLDPGFPAEPVEIGRLLSVQRDGSGPASASGIGSWVGSGLPGMGTADVDGASSTARPWCERLPYDATGPPAPR